MKIQKRYRLIIALPMFLSLVCLGCEGNNQKGRLVGAENIGLKKQLNTCNKNLAKKDKALQQAIKQRDAWKKEANLKLQSHRDEFIEALVQQNHELSVKAGKLDARIKELEQLLNEHK